MIRIVIENILLFLLPTLVYVAYAMLVRQKRGKAVLDDAPILALVATGTILMVGALTYLGWQSSLHEDQSKVPRFEQGKGRGYEERK